MHEISESDASKLFEWLMVQCPSCSSFNMMIVPIMKAWPEHRKAGAEEAKRRKYKPNREKGTYEL